MKRRRVDPKSFDLSIPHALCGYKIQPAEILRTGWSDVKRSACGNDFDSMVDQKPPFTS